MLFAQHRNGFAWTMRVARVILPFRPNDDHVSYCGKGKGKMSGVSARLEQVQLDMWDQADYVQHLIDEFDLPYDISCAMQMTVHDIRAVVRRIRALKAELPDSASRGRVRKAATKRKKKG
jgi:hypothetical protein